MNLAYIVNNLKSIVAKNNVIDTVHHATTTLISADGAAADCAGCNTMAIRLTASTIGNLSVLRTLNVFLEGKSTTNANFWERIPVYNSNRVLQPYISIINAALTNDGYLTPTYFANISGFVQVRTRLEYLSGTVGIGISSTITNAPFQIEKIPVTVRNMVGINTILPRDFEYIGRPYGLEGGKSDGNNLYPIWIGDAKYCEIVLTNNTNKTIQLKEVRMHDAISDSISTNLADSYLLELDVLAGQTLRVNSIDYPNLINFPGLSFQLGQKGRLTGAASTGTYNFKLNVR